MSGRQGGKGQQHVSSIKAPKKDAKAAPDEDDVAFKAKQKKEQEEMKAAATKAAVKGPMGGGGIK
ncbi:MAG: hypothetical protein TREMPRED_004894, partial [Tremellales sp. Tagirdzhanova-0007]